jgi:hypothetical protein
VLAAVAGSLSEAITAVSSAKVAMVVGDEGRSAVYMRYKNGPRKRTQTKEKCKLRLRTKAYKPSYNYITINLVGRSFGKWRRRRFRSGGSRRVRRMSFGCAVRHESCSGLFLA